MKFKSERTDIIVDVEKVKICWLKYIDGTWGCGSSCAFYYEDEWDDSFINNYKEKCHCRHPEFNCLTDDAFPKCVAKYGDK